MHWRELTSVDQLDQLVQDSHQHAVAIFKHSTRCSISSMAKSRVERSWNFNDTDLPIYYLDLIRYRDVSNRIAEVTGVVHQSPQLIVIKDGDAIHHSSHSAIDVNSIAV